MHGNNQLNLDLRLLVLFVKLNVCMHKKSGIFFIHTHTNIYIVCTQLALSKTCYLFL